MAFIKVRFFNKIRALPKPAHGTRSTPCAVYTDGRSADMTCVSFYTGGKVNNVSYQKRDPVSGECLEHA